MLTLAARAYGLGSLFLLLSACGPSRDPPERPRAEPETEVANADDVAQQVTDFLEAVDHAVSQLDFAALAMLATPDVTWFGPRAVDSLVGRPSVARDAREALGIPPAATASVDSPFVRVGVAPDGRSAWASERMNVTVAFDGRTTTTSYRVTSVAFRDGERWTIAAQHWSRGLPEGPETPPGGGAWPAPAPLRGTRADRADELLEALEDALDDGGLAAIASSRADAFGFGPRDAEQVQGGGALRGVLSREELTGLSLESDDDVQKALAPSGTLGFVACHLVPASGGAAYRALVVFLREAGEWRVVQAHLSLGLP